MIGGTGGNGFISNGTFRNWAKGSSAAVVFEELAVLLDALRTTATGAASLIATTVVNGAVALDSSAGTEELATGVVSTL